MFDYLRKILLPGVSESVVSPESKPNKSETKKLEVATCALFVEMANADGEFSEDERKKIVKVMKETFDLENECRK